MLYFSVALALIGLFAIGVYAGILSGKNRWLRGLEIAFFGSIVFGISFAAGYLIPIAFHERPQAF